MSKEKNDDGSQLDLATELLAREYIWKLEEGENAGTRLIAMISALVAIYGFFFGVVLVANKDAYPDWFWFTAPVLPFLVTGYILGYSLNDTIRGFYVRALERALASRLGAEIDLQTGELRSRMQDEPPGSDLDRLPYPLSGHLGTAIASSRRGFLEVRLLQFIGGGLYLLPLAATILVSRSRIDDVRVEWLLIAVYGLLFLLAMRLSWAITLGGYDSWQRAVRGLGPAFKRSLVVAGPVPATGTVEPSHSQRSAFRYLLVPRPHDAIFKGLALVFPSYLAGLASRRWVGFDFTNALTVALGFELLLYQARYLINDLIGWNRDSLDPDATARARPQVLGITRPTLFAMAMVRLLGWLLLIRFVDDRGLVPIVTVALIGVTVAYELLRQIRTRSRLLVVAMMLASGAGLAIRCVLGLGLALRPADFDVSGAWWWAAALYMVLGGGALQAMYWVTDASRFIPTIASPPAPTYDMRVEEKPYVLTAARWAGWISDAAVGTDAIDPASRPTARALLETKQRLLAPWSVAMAFSCGSGGWLGWILAENAFEARALIIMLAGAAGMLVLHRINGRNLFVALAAVLLVEWSIIGCVIGTTAELGRPTLCLVPFFLMAVTYCLYRRMSYRDFDATVV